MEFAIYINHFQGQIWNLLYLGQNGPIATKRKTNISIDFQASNVTKGFDLGHDLDILIFKVKCDLDHLVTKVRCKDLPYSGWRSSLSENSFFHFCRIWTI